MCGWAEGFHGELAREKLRVGIGWGKERLRVSTRPGPEAWIRGMCRGI